MLKLDANDRTRRDGPEGVREDFDRRAKLFEPTSNGAGSPPRFALIPFANLRPGTTPIYCVKGLLPRVGLAVFWGPPKCGKSFKAFDMMLHVALGWWYRERRVQQGPVVYCAFEGAEGFKTRAEAFRLTHNIPADQAVPFYLIPTRVDLARDHAALIASIQEQCPEPVAVVLDTLNRSLSGSESSDQDMSLYIQAADAIREAFNCAVVIVHHCGIDGTRPRGHTSLTGAVEAQCAIRKEASGCVTLTVEHMKDGPEGEVIASTLQQVQIGTDDDGDGITSCVVIPADVVPTRSEARDRLPASAQIALGALVEALTECGAVPPASNHIPAKVRAVTVEQWRTYAYRRGVSKGEPRAQQKAFKTALEALAVRNRIGIWDPYVWLVDWAEP